MEWISLDTGEVSEHGSLGLHMSEAARVKDAKEFRVHLAAVSPGGLLGRHPARLWQLFTVVSGSGWECSMKSILAKALGGRQTRAMSLVRTTECSC
jgi:hypothetical protein